MPKCTIRQGAPGIEPGTSRSAVECSTTELYPRAKGHRPRATGQGPQLQQRFQQQFSTSSYLYSVRPPRKALLTASNFLLSLPSALASFALPLPSSSHYSHPHYCALHTMPASAKRFATINIPASQCPGGFISYHLDGHAQAFYPQVSPNFIHHEPTYDCVCMCVCS